MATNYENLKTAWQAAIAAAVSAGDLTATQSYESLFLLDQWLAAEQALAFALADATTSYSIAGRSVTRAGHDPLMSAVAGAKARFIESLYGYVTHADISGASETSFSIQ